MLQTIWFKWNENYSIKNHFLYIIYISFLNFLLFFFFSSKYKHGKNEVTVNVQVPKQKTKWRRKKKPKNFLTQNRCGPVVGPWVVVVVSEGGAPVWTRCPLQARASIRTVNNSRAHSKKRKKRNQLSVNNQWHLRSNQQITSPKESELLIGTQLHHTSCEIIY